MFCDYGKKMNGMLHGLTYSVRMGLITALLWLGYIGTASAVTLNQPMTGATAPGWVVGGSAYLTAGAGVDPAGNGWLRLTEPVNDTAGFAYYDSAFDISQGAVIQYDYVTWGGNGADGYSIYLFDATYSFSVGASGGSLGYAQKTVAPLNPGLSGGYIGIGVDEFGNYSNPTEGRIGGTGSVPNAVAVRGPWNHPSGNYYYLGGNAAGTPLAFSGQAFRPGQSSSQYRKVVIYLTPMTAPNYLQIDVYVQFGYNQPLTPVITGLYTGRAIPASVKVGYAASTGGQTNYHEIRNLVVSSLPANVDLSIAKTVSSPTVAPGGAVTYTLTAVNLGPNPTTATNAPITDTLPSQLTGVTWTCVGTGGATCSAASGSGNINTTATLPFNGVATYTVTGTVNPSTTLGTQIVNTASITAPTGLTDYNLSNNSSTATTTVTNGNINISGTIYNDANHNGTMDGGETGATATNIGNTYYVKVYNSSDLTTRVGLATVSGGASTYSVSVPAFGTYTVILSSDNSTNFTPSFSTNGQWIYTTPINYTTTSTAAGSNVTGLNFGVYQGSRISGKVINDNGAGGAAANANDGILNGGETGISGATVKLQNNGGGTTYDTAITDSNGNYALFTNTASATLRIAETNAAAYPLSVNYNAGNTTVVTAYTTASDYFTFSYTRYTDYSGVDFSDVAANTFLPTPRAANVTAGSSVYYAHTFMPGSGGSVTFSATGRTQGTWPAMVYYLDANCSGSYQAGDAVISSAIVTTAGTPVCILVKDTVPASATVGTTDQIVTTAAFTYTNSIGPVTSALTVTDTTTVVAPASLTILKSASPSPKANPGQVVTYTILVTNTGTGVATNVAVTDSLSPYTYFGVNSYGAGVPFQFVNGTPSSGFSVGSLAYSYSNDNGVSWTYSPSSMAGGAPAGYDANVTNWKISMTGNMAASGANFTINFQALVK